MELIKSNWYFLWLKSNLIFLKTKDLSLAELKDWRYGILLMFHVPVSWSAQPGCQVTRDLKYQLPLPFWLQCWHPPHYLARAIRATQPGAEQRGNQFLWGDWPETFSEREESGTLCTFVVVTSISSSVTIIESLQRIVWSDSIVAMHPQHLTDWDSLKWKLWS